MKKVFRTGEVAKICRVAPRTVSKWFDAGMLKGYRVPNSKDRRIPRDSLIAFMREHNVPLDLLEDDAYWRFLSVCVDNSIAAKLDNAAQQKAQEGLRYLQANDAVEAGMHVQDHKVFAVIVDLTVGRNLADSVITKVRQKMQNVATLAIIGEDGHYLDEARKTYTEVVQLPVDDSSHLIDFVYKEFARCLSEESKRY